MTTEDADKPGQSDRADYADREGKIGADTVGGYIKKDPAGTKRHKEEHEGPREYQAGREGASKGGRDENQADDAEREADLARCSGYLTEGEADPGELGWRSDGCADGARLDIGRHHDQEEKETGEEQEDERSRSEKDTDDSGKEDFEVAGETDDGEKEGSNENVEKYKC